MDTKHGIQGPRDTQAANRAAREQDVFGAQLAEFGRLSAASICNIQSHRAATACETTIRNAFRSMQAQRDAALARMRPDIDHEPSDDTEGGTPD